MPFIVCVRRHGKESILREFARRLENDHGDGHESRAGRDFPHRRAAARSAGQAHPISLKVHGHLSTHVLDVHGGHPAEGVSIELCEVAANGTARASNAPSPMPTAVPTSRSLPPRRSRSRPMNCASRSAIISRAANVRWPTRRSLALCRCVLRSQSRRAAITCRFRHAVGLLDVSGQLKVCPKLEPWCDAAPLYLRIVLTILATFLIDLSAIE